MWGGDKRLQDRRYNYMSYRKQQKIKFTIQGNIIVKVLICFMIFMMEYQTAYASETNIGNEISNEVLERIDIQGVEEVMGDIFPQDKISFSDLIHTVIKNDYEGLNDKVYTYLTGQVLYELSYNKNTIIHILLLTIFASIFTNFSNAFGNSHISQIGFYVIYMMLLMISLQSFQVITTAMAIKIQELLIFMSALCPVYFLTVAIAKGAHSSIVFYNLSLFYIYAVEFLIGVIIIPLINAYIVIEVLNYLSMEKKLTKMAKLIKMLIQWMIKIMLAGVIGLNVVQGLISPLLDSIERSIWIKSAEAVPVLGDAMGGTAEVMFTSLQLVKNGVGLAGVIVCICIISGPVIQMLFLTLMYKCISAIIEPISDTRISACIDSIGEGCQLLLKTMLASGLLFMITIAIVSATTT